MNANERTKYRTGLIFCVAILLMVGLRCMWLESDAYPRLSWSSALLTDEGFYIHNARNRVLFGHPQTDLFNNALIMPLLDAVQTMVFRLFGVGVVQARSISVTLGLLTILIFYDALRRGFGKRPAWIGALLLGMDHVSLLYSRLALMDTPAALVLVSAFWLWVRSGEEAKRAPFRLALCGLTLGVCYAVRGLGALVYPAPILLLAREAWKTRRKEGDWGRLPTLSLVCLVGGLMLALSVYVAFWYLPNHAELARVNRFYLFVQLVPDSLENLRYILLQTLFGDERGYCAYLFRHAPIQFILSLLAVTFWGIRRGKVGFRGAARRNVLYLGIWLLVAWAAFGCVRYSPPRYYIIFYPALTGIAALAVCRLRIITRTVWRHRVARTLLGAFLTYHLCQAGLHHLSAVTDFVLYSTVTLSSLALFLAPSGKGRRRVRWKWSPVSALAVWMLINALWLGDWLTHVTYKQREADRWLAANLPPHSVLIGDAAPGLCLNNRFVAVNMISGLCNDYQPLETYAAWPRYIVILGGERNLAWWRYYYPDVIQPQNLKRFFPRLINFEVPVYEVPKDAALPSPPIPKP